MANLKDRADTRIIDGVTYRCWPVLFGVGRPLLVRAFKAVAPAFAAAFKDGVGQGTQMASALEAIARDLSDEDVAKFASTFSMASEFEDGEKWPPLDKHMDMHFAGRYDAFLQWLIFAMEVNGFARFFSTLSDEASSVTPTLSPTPTSP